MAGERLVGDPCLGCHNSEWRRAADRDELRSAANDFPAGFGFVTSDDRASGRANCMIRRFDVGRVKNPEECSGCEIHLQRSGRQSSLGLTSMVKTRAQEMRESLRCIIAGRQLIDGKLKGCHIIEKRGRYPRIPEGATNQLSGRRI